MIKQKVFDYWIFIAVLLLLATGVIMVFSASTAYSYVHYKGDTYFFLKKQLFWATVGIIAMLVCSKIDYMIFGGLSPILLVVSMVLLALVRVPGIGSNINGSYRWF